MALPRLAPSTSASAAGSVDDDAEHRIGGDGGEQRPHRRRLFGRRQGVKQDMQRQKRQAEPDGDAAERLGEAAAAGAEGDEPDDEQRRRDCGNIERQELHDQRGADIGAEHDGERGHQADHAVGGERGGHQAGRGARLQQRGQAEAGGEGGEAVAQRLAQGTAQVRPERAQHAAQDHMQAPQQQRHAAHQVKEHDRSHQEKNLLLAHLGPCTDQHNPKIGLVLTSFPGAAQHVAKRSGALQTRDRHER
jgi:hypothetical protein